MESGVDHLENLGDLLNRISSDDRLKAIHITLYTALIQAWISYRCRNPFQVSRRRLMKLSHIRSKTNYHRCIRDLVSRGYLSYEPSYHPKNGTTVSLLGPQSETILEADSTLNLNQL